MDFHLRREETLDGERLRTMLNENPAQAAQAILGAATANVLEAQALLAQILLDGLGITRDPALALRWFEIAARRGHTMARNMLGRCHEHGWGCLANPVVAAQHYRIAAQSGLDWGLYNYANLLGTGRGVVQDQALALACYRRAAVMGHAKSMNLLGRYLELGLGCATDMAQARHWYKHSALAGDFRGQFSYAAVLADQGRIQQSLQWLTTALEGGNLNFLRVSGPVLAQAGDPKIRAMAGAYQRKAAELAG